MTFTTLEVEGRSLPDMRSVYSSHIDEIGYDESSQELHVKWQNGKITVYMGVPPEVFAQVNASASIGKSLHELVRGKYAHGTKAE